MIKEQVRKSGRGIASFIRLSPDTKLRIRFASEFGDAVIVKEHDKWGILSPTPCLKHHFEKDCEFCKIVDVRTRDGYCWTVYDYKAKKRKIFKWPATSRSPVAQLIAIYDTYGTLLDRDYVISRRGSRLDTVYSIMPLDKRKLRKQLKQFSAEKILEKCLELSGEIAYDEIEDLPEYAGEDAEFSEFDEEEYEEDEFEEEELEEGGEFEEEEDENEFEDEEDEFEESEKEEEDFEEEEKNELKKRKISKRKKRKRK